MRVDGIPVWVDTRKATALLAYLTEREVPPTRDELVWLLWPTSTADRGRGALRRTISSLRSALDGRWVHADRERIHLDRDQVDLDTAHLDDAGGLDLVRGRFLEGFSLRDAPDFDDWLATTAEHYDRRIRAGRAARARSRLESGDTAGAVADAERRLAIDPLDESSHRLLMLALARHGDRAGALRQYRACVAMLDDELAVDPLAETVDLYESILAGDVTSVLAEHPLPPINAPTMTMAGDIGHSDLEDLLRRSSSTPGSVRIAGPPGSGRTTLVLSAVSSAVWATAHPSDRHVPHGLTRSLLEALAADSTVQLDERAAAAVLVEPGLARRSPEPPRLTGDLAPGRLLDGIVSAVAKLLAERVLVIDDIPNADPASEEVIARLEERALELGIRLVTIGTTPGAGATIGMTPLDEAVVTGLAEKAGHSPDIVPAVIAATGGWVGPVVEIVGSADPLTAIADLRSRRVLELDPLTRQVLEALVVLGSSHMLDVAAVAGRPAEEVADALDRLADGGMVSKEPPVETAAPWVSDAVVTMMGTARLALLHGRAAEALGGADDAQSASARARHFEQAGRQADAARAHAAAARAAAELFAPAAVREHVEAAVALGHSNTGDLHRLLGTTHMRTGDYQAAIRAFNAGAAAGTSWDLEQAIGDVYARWGRWELATASLEEALNLTDEPEHRAAVLADLALVAERSGDHEGSATRIREALAQIGDTDGVAARVLNVAGLILDAPEHLLAAITRARRTGRREDEAAALNNLALAYGRRDRIDEAIPLAERSLELLDRTGDRHRRAAIHGNLADLFHAAGNQAASQDHLRKAVSLFAEVGVGEWVPEIWKLTAW